MWKVQSGDILGVEADVLVCSANPFLTLSGGVGGAFLLRYGPEMQERLRAHLDELGIRHVPPGTVVSMPPCGSPYSIVLHAVAVDGAYESSPQLVTQVVERTLTQAEKAGARNIVLPALATGYGKLSKQAFAEGLSPLVSHRSAVDVVICLKREDDAALIRRILEMESE